MKRTTRLVQRALAGRPAPEAWARGAADVAVAVARSGGGTRQEGGPGGASAGGPGSPGGVSSRVLAQAFARPRPSLRASSPKPPRDEDWSIDVDVSEKITSLLSSAESVTSFRLDSSKWTHHRCLEEWLVLLSEKSVQSLDLLNLGHKVSTEFPIENVQSKDLQMLRIGFFRVSLDLHCFNYSSLRTLDFFCCALETDKLSWVVTDCHSLKVLKIHYCCIDLHIKSSSLEVLDSFGNTGNRIVIVSAPKLLSLGCGMIPIQKSQVIRQRIVASVSLNIVPMLKIINHLIIPYHRLTLNSKDLTKDVLPSVERLNLSLEMADCAQLQGFRKLLEAMPMLQHLFVDRMDSIGHNEGFGILIEKPFDDISMVECVKRSLATFSLLEFRGGSSEKHLILSLLKNAQNLKLLRTSRCVSVPKREIHQAVKQMKRSDRASEACQLIFE